MAKIDSSALKNIHLFICKLREAGYHISKAYLFGSHVKGRADEWSDIDIAIISPQISNDRFEERVKLTEMAVNIDDRLEPLPFNPETFTDEDPFVRQIVNEGIIIVT